MNFDQVTADLSRKAKDMRVHTLFTPKQIRTANSDLMYIVLHFMNPLHAGDPILKRSAEYFTKRHLENKYLFEWNEELYLHQNGYFICTDVHILISDVTNDNPEAADSTTGTTYTDTENTADNTM